jgi:hypothetical protein
LVLLAHAAPPPHLFFQVAGGDAGGWPDILACAGLHPEKNAGEATVFVVRGGGAEWVARVESGALVIVEGESESARAFGFRAKEKRVRVQSVEDARRADLRIVWEEAVELPVFETPGGARVFTRERWTGAPLAAGFRRGAGAVLWVAAPPGVRGYERFPYLLHALADLGFVPPFQSRRLWAFFDSSYRLRADPEYLARRWRRSGIAALHVAAWHFYDPAPQTDQYLRELIRACHRNAILVYAWLELPHVSEAFWRNHPEWREKTAVLQDAHLDWRKLMNLANPDCRRAVAAGVRRLIDAHDWDGVNLAELYFESLEGPGNPSRFTPMNDDVRAEFRRLRGIDPLDTVRQGAGDGLAAFLEYRAGLAARIQKEWLVELDAIRSRKPHLDIVLTHVDDRFDSGMREAIGADAARVLPLLDVHDFTFLIEDPATVWHLGPQRYPEIARRYYGLTTRAEKLAIDINVVERYQDVYPTKQQTGTELLQLVHLASTAFPRVALYFENSILRADLPLVPAAAAAVSRVERIGPRLAIDSRSGSGVAWSGPVRVDGSRWPAGDGNIVWLPPGRHVVEPDRAPMAARILDINAELRSAALVAGGIEFAYSSAGRALVALDRRPAGIELDGAAATVEVVETGEAAWVLVLPRGQHLVTVRVE